MPVARYLPRKVSKIGKTDTRVSIIGKIVSAEEASFTLEDETGKIEIAFNPEDDSLDSSKLQAGRIVRVYCSMIGDQLKADVVQNLDGFDLNLFKKVEELYNKAGV